MTDEQKKARNIIIGLEFAGATAAGIGSALGDTLAKRCWRKRALRAIDKIGGFEAFNDLAPRVAEAKLNGGYCWIPKLVHIRKEWMDKKLKVRRTLDLEDYRDICETCRFIVEAKKAKAAAEIFDKEGE